MDIHDYFPVDYGNDFSVYGLESYDKGEIFHRVGEIGQ